MGSDITIPIEPGEHNIQLRAPLGCSPVVTVQVGKDETISLEASVPRLFDDMVDLLRKIIEFFKNYEGLLLTIDSED